MPISFILSGLLLLHLLSDIRSFKISISRSLLYLFLIFYLIGFFYDSILIGKVYYNLFQLLSLLFLLLFVIKNKMHLLMRFIIFAIFCISISVRMDIDNFTFAVFDIDILVSAVYLFVLFGFAFNVYSKRRKYVKKNYFGSNAYNVHFQFCR